MTNGVELIRARRAANRQERAKYMEAIAKLEAEDAELQQAERVMSRLEHQSLKGGAVGKTDGMSIPRKGSPRPKDIPTTRAMIETVLAEAETTGKRGLPGKDILVEIDRRWWPGVGWTSILPDAHRLVTKTKTLRKHGKLFVRVQKDETPTEKSEGAS